MAMRAVLALVSAVAALHEPAVQSPWRVPRRAVLGAALGVASARAAPPAARAGLFGPNRREKLQARVEDVSATRRQIATVVKGLEAKPAAADSIDPEAALKYTRTYFTSLPDALSALAVEVGGRARKRGRAR